MMNYNNIYYFYGNLTLTIDRKVRAWKENFIGKHGEHAIISLSLEDISPSVLCRELETPPFLSNARLIIIRGSDLINKQYGELEYWEHTFQNISESSFIVFAHIHPSFTKLIEFLQANAQTKEFSLQDEQGALEIIRNELPSLSFKVHNMMSETLGGSPLRLQSELAKFSLIPNLRDEDVLQDLDITPERMVFKSIDALLGGNLQQALRHLSLRDESNPFELFIEVLRALRKGALYCALLENGTKGSTASSATGIKEYPAKKYNSLSSQSRQSLVRLYVELANGEADFKIGKIKTEGEGIELFITTSFLNYHFSLIQR